MKNTYIKHSYSLKIMMDHWKGQKTEGDKGGSFNLQLYLDYLAAQEAIATIKPVKR